MQVQDLMFSHPFPYGPLGTANDSRKTNNSHKKNLLELFFHYLAALGHLRLCGVWPIPCSYFYPSHFFLVRHFWRASKVRWVLGAREIMFTNPVTKYEGE